MPLQPKTSPSRERIIYAASNAATDEEKAILGTNTPNVDALKALRDSRLAAQKNEQMRNAGESIEKTGMNLLGQPESTMGMSEKDKFFSEGRAIDRKQLGRFKSFGDKSDFETQNALRKLRGEKELYASPEQFYADVNKSMVVGATSALNTPEGRQRATAAGVQSGLSFADADQAVQNAFKNLQAVGKREGAIAKANAPAAPTAATTTDQAQNTKRFPAKPTGPSMTTEAPSLSETKSGIVSDVMGSMPSSRDVGDLGRSSDIVRIVNKGLVKDLTGQVAKGLSTEGKAVEGVRDAAKLAKSGLVQKLLDAVNKITPENISYAPIARPPAGTRTKPILDALDKLKVGDWESAAKSATAAVKEGEAIAKAGRLAKGLTILNKIGGSKVVKGLGVLGNTAMVAEPIIEGFQLDEAGKEAKTQEAIDRYDEGLLSTVGKAVRDVLPTPYQVLNKNYSPVGTLFGGANAALFEAPRALNLAEGELATQQSGLNLAKKRGEASNDMRRTFISDEDYANLPIPEKIAANQQARALYLQSLRKTK
jgi:predicted transcriptional regulator